MFFIIISILIIKCNDSSRPQTEKSSIPQTSNDSSYKKPADIFTVNDSVEVNDSLIGKLIQYLESSKFNTQLSTFHRSDSLVKNRYNPNEIDTIILYKLGENYFRYYSNRIRTIFSDFHLKKIDLQIKETAANIIKITTEFGYNSEKYPQYFNDFTGLCSAKISKDYIEFYIYLD